MTWWNELEADFEQKLGERLSERDSNALYGAITETVGRPDEAFVHAVDFEGEELAAIMMVGDTAYLVGFSSGVTTIRFLGTPRGGRYLERVQFDDEGGRVVELSFRHEALDWNEVSARREFAPAVAERRVPEYGAAERLARWEELRRRLQAWTTEST